MIAAGAARFVRSIGRVWSKSRIDDAYAFQEWHVKRVLKAELRIFKEVVSALHELRLEAAQAIERRTAPGDVVYEIYALRVEALLLSVRESTAKAPTGRPPG